MNCMIPDLVITYCVIRGFVILDLANPDLITLVILDRVFVVIHDSFLGFVFYTCVGGMFWYRFGGPHLVGGGAVVEKSATFWSERE